MMTMIKPYNIMMPSLFDLLIKTDSWSVTTDISITEKTEKTDLVCQDPDILVAISMETVDTACIGTQRHVVLRGRHASVLKERRINFLGKIYVYRVQKGEGVWWKWRFLRRSSKLTLILLLSPSGARSEWESRTLIRQRVGSIFWRWVKRTDPFFLASQAQTGYYSQGLKGKVQSAQMSGWGCLCTHNACSLRFMMQCRRGRGYDRFPGSAT